MGVLSYIHSVSPFTRLHLQIMVSKEPVTQVVNKILKKKCRGLMNDVYNFLSDTVNCPIPLKNFYLDSIRIKVLLIEAEIVTCLGN